MLMLKLKLQRFLKRSHNLVDAFALLVSLQSTFSGNGEGRRSSLDSGMILDYDKWKQCLQPSLYLLRLQLTQSNSNFSRGIRCFLFMPCGVIL